MPYDPYKKIDPTKPFGDRSRFSSPDSHPLEAHILDRAMNDGYVRIYHDETKTVWRTEISVKEGFVNIYKVKDSIADKFRYKKIDISTPTNELLDTIDIVTENVMVYPTHRFVYRRMPLGKGNGDIETAIINQLLDTAEDPRFSGKYELDQPIMEAIKNILAGKSV